MVKVFELILNEPPLVTLKTEREISISIVTIRFVIVTLEPTVGTDPPTQVEPSLKFAGVQSPMDWTTK